MNRRVPMESSRVRLRHVEPSDYADLYRIEADQATLHTWRYRGNFPEFDKYEAALWAHTQAVMVVESRSTGTIAGYLHLHDVDTRAGHGWFSVYADPEYRGRGTVMEGWLLFFDWVFANTELRWIYAHVFAHNWPQFDSSVCKGHARHLGTHRDRVSVRGELADVHVIGTSREMWESDPVRARLHRKRSSASDPST